MEPCQANPQAEHSVLFVLGGSCSHGRRHFLAGLDTTLAMGMTSISPKSLCPLRRRLLCFAAEMLGKAKTCFFKFLTDIAESESGRAVLWDMLGFAFSFP